MSNDAIAYARILKTSTGDEIARYGEERSLKQQIDDYPRGRQAVRSAYCHHQRRERSSALEPEITHTRP